MAKKTTNELTILQERFADILFSMPEPNQKEAYIKAGYKARGASAESKASRLVRNGKVKAYIDELRDKRTKKTEIDAEYVISGLKNIVEKNKDERPGVATKALDLLGKHLGLYEADNAQRGDKQLIIMNFNNDTKQIISG